MESANGPACRDGPAVWQMNAALREAEIGNAAQARNVIAAALALAATRGVRILAAVALARAGDSERSQKLADELQKQNPLSTTINGYWLPTIRAAIEINRQNPEKAIEILQTAAPYELGNPSPQAGVGEPCIPYIYAARRTCCCAREAGRRGVPEIPGASGRSGSIAGWARWRVWDSHARMSSSADA